MRKRKKILKQAVLLLGIGIIAILLIGNAKPSAEFKKTEIHYVHPGDTLWSIAGEYNGESVDKRYVVYCMKELNNGLTSTIQVGQEIIVPVYE